MVCDCHRVQIIALVRELSKFGTVKVNQTKSNYVTNLKVVNTHKYKIVASVVINKIPFEIEISHIEQNHTIRVATIAVGTKSHRIGKHEHDGAGMLEESKEGSLLGAVHSCEKIATSIVFNKRADHNVTVKYVIDHESIDYTLLDMYDAYFAGTINKFNIPESKVKFVAIEEQASTSSTQLDGMFGAYAQFASSGKPANKKSAWDD
jgi:hypothetical protein